MCLDSYTTESDLSSCQHLWCILWLTIPWDFYNYNYNHNYTIMYSCDSSCVIQVRQVWLDLPWPMFVESMKTVMVATPSEWGTKRQHSILSPLNVSIKLVMDCTCTEYYRLLAVTGWHQQEHEVINVYCTYKPIVDIGISILLCIMQENALLITHLHLHWLPEETFINIDKHFLY